MKKLILFASVAVFAVSCKKDDENTTTNSVVGTWKITKRSLVSGANNSALYSDIPDACEGKSTINFQSNGNVLSHYYALNSSNQCIDDGTDTYPYNYNKNTKILTVDGEDMEVITLTNSTMELHSPSSDQDYNGDGKIDKFIITLNK